MKKLSPSSTGSRESRRAEAHRVAGVHAQRAQKWDTATREFERATELAPTDSLMWLNLARARVRGGQIESAENAARQAFDIDPSPVACRIVADVLVQLNRPAEALPFFDRLDPEAPRDHELYAAHGNALFLARRPREAVDAYFNALALKVDDALSHYRLGLAFMDLDMASEASECFRTALSLGNPVVRALSHSPL
ncbi:MAG: hypothetical protein JWQ16_2525, partial [Novosphingobium sp.]|nr:hypothetical protein [Novosphingobium sp.]